MTGLAYYNENEPYAAQWLRNLIAAGHIAPGEVDERSIVDVRADDLRGYKQVHCFAGVGVWSHALRLASFPDDREVWTGSCPCQPFSAAGKGGADEDARHLWPHWLRLIAECRPSIIFGEQVSAAIRIGWLDDVFTSLEQLHYACGAIDFPACSVGAPHIRQRLYFVADSQQRPAERRGHDLAGAPDSLEGEARQRERLRDESRAGIDARRMAYPDGRNASTEGLQRSGEHGQQQEDGGAGGELGDADTTRSLARQLRQGATEHSGPGATNGFWRDADWLPCIDGKARPTERTTESKFQSMADGLAARLGYMRSGESWTLAPLIVKGQNRAGRLRAYGNAIVAPVAAEFVKAFMEVKP